MVSHLCWRIGATSRVNVTAWSWATAGAAPGKDRSAARANVAVPAERRCAEESDLPESTPSPAPADMLERPTMVEVAVVYPLQEIGHS